MAYSDYAFPIYLRLKVSYLVFLSAFICGPLEAAVPRLENLGAPPFDNTTGIYFSIGPNLQRVSEDAVYAFAQGSTVGRAPRFFMKSLSGSGTWQTIAPAFPYKFSRPPSGGAIRAVQSLKTKHGLVFLISAILEYPETESEVVILRLNFRTRSWEVVDQRNEKAEGFALAVPTNFVYIESSNSIMGLTKLLASFGAEDEFGGVIVSRVTDSQGADALGKTWSKVPIENFDHESDLPFSIILSNPRRPSELWGSTENPCRDKGGVALSEDGGRRWIHLFNSIPTRQVKQMFIQSDNQTLIIVASHIGSTYDTNIQPGIFEVNLSNRLVKRTNTNFSLQHLSCDRGSECQGIVGGTQGTPGKYLELDRKSWRVLRSMDLDIGNIVLPSPGSNDTLVSFSTSSNTFVKITMPK